jgi:hypothetical protein
MQPHLNMHMRMYVYICIYIYIYIRMNSGLVKTQYICIHTYAYIRTERCKEDGVEVRGCPAAVYVYI